MALLATLLDTDTHHNGYFLLINVLQTVVWQACTILVVVTALVNSKAGRPAIVGNSTDRMIIMSEGVVVITVIVVEVVFTFRSSRFVVINMEDSLVVPSEEDPVVQ